MSKLLIHLYSVLMSVYCFISMVGHHRGRSSRDSSPPCGNIITMAPSSSSPISSRGQSQLRNRSTTTIAATNSTNNSSNNHHGSSTSTTVVSHTNSTTSSSMNLQQKYDSVKRLVKKKDDEIFRLRNECRVLQEENKELKRKDEANLKLKRKLKERLYEGHTGVKSPTARKKANKRKQEKKKLKEKEYKSLLSRVAGGEIAICSLQNATSPTSP